jgi:hypothetical protein
MAPPVTLPTRKVGGENVTAISFGSMGMGAGYRGYITDIDERIEVILFSSSRIFNQLKSVISIVFPTSI